MVNRMEELNKIRSLNISQDKSTHQFKSRSDAAKPQGDLKEEIYDLYYDNDNTIDASLSSDPNNPDDPGYNQERVHDYCERNAPYIWVANDDPTVPMFVICSHKEDVAHWSRERPVYAQQFKAYKNVFELRLRSEKKGLAYRVSEYEMGII